MKSGEFVHIDFGIAFEGGRLLPTPETIPFRLTQEIISAMGVTGYNGQFRQSAETTLQVLKDNQTMIMAILEVLIHDPLYTWEITNEKKIKTQKDESTFDLTALTNQSTDKPCEERNVAAERVLDRVLNKLNCRVENSSVQFSIKGVIDSVIQQAVNEQNLSKLFCGWQPYL